MTYCYECRSLPSKSIASLFNDIGLAHVGSDRSFGSEAVGALLQCLQSDIGRPECAELSHSKWRLSRDIDDRRSCG